MDTDDGYRRDRIKASGYGSEDADADAGSDRWLLSYADLTTTLMVFFLALYVLQLTKTREAEMKSFEARVSQDRKAPTMSNAPYTIAAGQDVARRDLLLQLEKLQDNRHITVKSDAQGVEIEIDARILFNSGDARLLPESFNVLDQIAAALRKRTDNNILVEGHTDSVPISNVRYASNWELSSARAGAVVRFLVDRGVVPRRLAAVGRADNFPLVMGDDAVTRSMNRRVTVLVQY